MANTVMVLTRAQADNIDALNRKAKATSAMENGAPLTLAFPSEGEVFTATKATSGLVFNVGRKEPIVIAEGSVATEGVDAWLLEVKSNSGVWLAYSPEVNKQIVGEVWGGQDPRNFTNRANVPFDAVKLEVGDIIQVSKDFFKDTKDPETVTGANTVTLGADGFVSSVES